jgi:hypothetical protein
MRPCELQVDGTDDFVDIIDVATVELLGVDCLVDRSNGLTNVIYCS